MSRSMKSWLFLFSMLALILMPGVGCKKEGEKKVGSKPAVGQAAAPEKNVLSGKKVGEVSALLAVATGERAGVAVKEQGSKGKWTSLKVGQAVALGSTLRTTKGARARLALEGGVVLHLNEDTRLELAGPAKVVLSSGSLLVDKEPGEADLFTIATPQGSVKVTGTKLHLKVEEGADTVDVTRGTVEINAGGAEVELGAGERAVLRKGKSPRVLHSKDLSYVTRWAREITPPAEQQVEARPGFGSLTARVPGQGKSHALSLASHQVRVVVRDNVARTEIEQRYHNAGSQTLEGTYRFPLPAGANISRLALYVGSRLEEGEIVERRRAKRIFKQIVDDSIRPRDPALLEWVGGRMFQMKIFPIPPHSSRRVILAYTQVLEASYGRYRYEYPMTSEAGKATEVGKFSVEMKVASSLGLGKVSAPLYPVTRERKGDQLELRYEASSFKPTASFVVEMRPEKDPPELQLALYEASTSGGACAVRDHRPVRRIRSATSLGGSACGDRGGFFMALLRPELSTTERAKPRDHLFILDSSYNTTPRNWALQGTALEAFLSEMDLRSRFNVMVCDSKCKTWSETFKKPRPAQRSSALSFVRALATGGASDIQGAFEEAARRAAALGKGVKVVYMGDGKPTAGELREPQLAELVVAALRQAGATLDMLQVGEDASTMFMAQATRRLSGAVHVLGPGDDLGSRIFDMVAAQYRPTLTDLEISFEGGLDAHHVYPGQLSSLSAGSEVMLVGRYGEGGKGAIKVRGKIGARTFERRYPVNLAAQPSEAQANGFIPRVWAHHHLEALSLANATANRPEIVRISQAYTVLSRPTAFLVLENERMYREFRVKRKRNRQYWKGDSVATRGAKDQPETEKSADTTTKIGMDKGEGGGAVKSLGKAASSGAGGTASGAAAADESKSRYSSMRKNKEASRAKGAAPSEALDSLAAEPSADMAYKSEERAQDDDELRGPTATPAGEPDSAPRPVATAKPRPKPKKKPASAPGRSFSRPPPAKPTSGMAHPSRRRSRRPYGYYYRWKRVRTGAIQPLLSYSLTSSGQRNAARFRAAVSRQPLRRANRRALHKWLMINGDYKGGLNHAEEWTKLDSDSSQALRALADVQVVTGKSAEAARTYGSSVEVNPYSTRIQGQMAQMYLNKGDLRRSCAHRWSMVSIRPRRISYNLALVRCLAALPDGKDLALRVLSQLSADPRARRYAAAIGRALASLQSGAMAKPLNKKPSTRGALVVSATWSKPVDLDLAVVTPRGERISALQGTRRGKVEADSRDGRTAEVLRLAYAPSGTYRVEISRPDGAQDDTPITGTIIVRAHGKSRTIPFVISTANKPLAQVKLSTRRVRVRYR